MWAVIFLVGVGVFFGYLIGVGVSNYEHYKYERKPNGFIIIDESNENKTKWDLHVNTDPDKIPKMKSILLEVHVKK